MHSIYKCTQCCCCFDFLKELFEGLEFHYEVPDNFELLINTEKKNIYDIEYIFMQGQELTLNIFLTNVKSYDYIRSLTIDRIYLDLQDKSQGSHNIMLLEVLATSKNLLEFTALQCTMSVEFFETLSQRIYREKKIF